MIRPKQVTLVKLKSTLGSVVPLAMFLFLEDPAIQNLWHLNSHRWRQGSRFKKWKFWEWSEVQQEYQSVKVWKNCLSWTRRWSRAEVPAKLWEWSRRPSGSWRSLPVPRHKCFCNSLTCKYSHSQLLFTHFLLFFSNTFFGGACQCQGTNAFANL